MKWLVIISALCLLCVSAVPTAFAQNEGTFAQFFSELQKAVNAGDKEKVASMINFDNFTWEASDALRQVKSKEAFLKHYDEMFTPIIKAKILKERPTKVDENVYFINWYSKKIEYTLDFTRKKTGGPFRFHGLTVNPA